MVSNRQRRFGIKKTLTPKPNEEPTRGQPLRETTNGAGSST